MPRNSLLSSNKTYRQLQLLIDKQDINDPYQMLSMTIVRTQLMFISSVFFDCYFLFNCY